MSAGRGTVALGPDRPPARLEEAAEWWVVFQDTPEHALPAATVQAWQQWKADPENRKAFEDISNLPALVRASGRPPKPGPARLASDRFTASVSVAEWREGCRPVSGRGRIGGRPPRGTPRARSPRQRALALAVAASAIVALAAGFAGFVELSLVQRSGGEEARTYETESGEHRQALLSDGSTVELGAQTALAVRYTDQQRTVALDHGVAIFHVAHNVARPFVVEAGDGSITAVGTAFQVLHEGPRTVVTVTDGTVVVQPRELPAIGPVVAPPDLARPARWQPARVSRGEEIAIADGVAAVVEHADLDTATAWREGRLQYLGEPLRNVIADVNRYSRRHLRCEDTACDLLYIGTVFERDIDTWISRLPQIFPVEINEIDPDHVVVRPPPRPSR